MELSHTEPHANSGPAGSTLGGSLQASLPVAAPAQARFFTPKVAVWALMAGLAVAYLGVVFLKPGTIASYLPSAAPGNPEDNEGQRANAMASSEAKDLRDNVSQLQLDVAKIKTEIAERSDRDKALETRLAVLEETKRGIPAVAAAPAASAAAGKIVAAPAAAIADTVAAPSAPLTALTPAATAAAKVAAKKAAATAPKAAPATASIAAAAAAAQQAQAAAAAAAPANAAAALAPPLENSAGTAPSTPAANGVKLINSPLSASSAASKAAPAPVAPAVAPPSPATAVKATPANAAEVLAPAFETGSVQNLGAGELPAAKTAKPIGIYIGSGPSVDSLRLSWSLLADRNAESLRNLEPRYTTGIDSNGLNYGLVAGPLSSAADAQKVCKDLAAKAVTCRVGDFAGEAL